MVEAVKDYAIFMLDPTGHVASWNEGAERIKGYAAHEIIGRHFSVFYPPEALARAWPDRELAIAQAEGRLEDEGWRIRKDGSRFWSNVVISAIRDSEGSLVGFTKVTRDLTDRRRIESLELAERRMSEFLAMLSHELRNPLAPIRNAVSTMYLKEIEDPELKWARDVVDRQVTHLTRLVEDLLEVNRITSGTIRLEREPVRLSSVIDRAVEAVGPIVRSRGHQLEVVGADESLVVRGDVTRLTQVVTNLLNNAAKYTPEGGHIRLTLASDNDHALIIVRDDGVGIPEDQLKSIFDLFNQGRRTLDRAEGGLGIGLTLVRELVARHGGSVVASSGGVSKGSEFRVRLPLDPSVASSAEPKRGNSEVRRSAAARPRVMVVDDNPDIVESMIMLLEMWGYDVRGANDGQKALEVAAEYRPRIVLLDIGLPRTDGYTLARMLRELPGIPEMTLIALTGYGQRDDKRRSLDAGILYHLVKPADPDDLRQLLDDVSLTIDTAPA